MQLLPGDADAVCLLMFLNVQHADTMSATLLHIKLLLRAIHLICSFGSDESQLPPHPKTQGIE